MVFKSIVCYKDKQVHFMISSCIFFKLKGKVSKIILTISSVWRKVLLYLILNITDIISVLNKVFTNTY